MKKVIFCCLVSAIISCNSSNDKKIPDMEGTYFMNTQILNNGKKDTKYTDLKQLKMYTGNFYMYAQVNPSDSASAFGVGSYTTNHDSGTITETVIYRASDSIFQNDPAQYKLNITLTSDGYQQVIPEIEMDSAKYKLTEDYQKTGDSTKTPIDGVWKEIRSVVIKGADTSVNQRVQYKAYYRGYFMFGQYVKDSTSKNHTGIGFGTFKMKSDTELEETDLNSTYSIIAGHTFDVKIKMDGPDKYNQTILNGDGTTGIEYYERLKK